MDLSEPMDRAQCVALMRPHIPTFDECFRAAMKRWKAWLKDLPGSPGDVSARSRASVLYDFIAAEATVRFLGQPHVRVRTERGFLILRFHDQVALRFKKFTYKTLKTSSVATGQANAFQAQSLETSATVGPMTHLVAGYLLDRLAFDIEKLAITCTLYGDHLWKPIEFEAYLDAAAVATPISAASLTEMRPKVRSTRKRAEKELGNPS